jgi:hypothetical protein
MQYGTSICSVVIRIVSAADKIRNLKGFKISRNMFGKYTYSEVWYIHLSILAKTKKNVK